jgi:hypothetical protein
MYDPSTATWYLRNEDNAGPPDAGVFRYGAPGWIPVVGDWDGNGTTTIGVVNPNAGGYLQWFLRNSNSAGAPDIAPFLYGLSGWQPVVGDWSGSGKTQLGVVAPGGNWYLGAGPNIVPFAYGASGWTPVAGTWVSDNLVTDLLNGKKQDRTALDAVFGG